MGASHQTGWTATVAKFVADLAKTRESGYSCESVTPRDGVKGK